LRVVLANSLSCFSDIDFSICFEAPLRLDFGRFPRFAANAAPAAICCFFDLAGILVFRRPMWLWLGEGCIQPWRQHRTAAVSADERASTNSSPDSSDRLQLNEDDTRLLEEEARRLRIAKEDLIKRIVEEMTTTLPSRTAGQATPDELVSQAVQAFIAKRKGERSPDR
jgi:hypothetical protein